MTCKGEGHRWPPFILISWIIIIISNSEVESAESNQRVGNSVEVIYVIQNKPNDLQTTIVENQLTTLSALRWGWCLGPTAHNNGTKH